MHNVWRIEHLDRPCAGPSKLFTLGVYSPGWCLEMPCKSLKRPRWPSDDKLIEHIDTLEPVTHRECNGHVHHDWYFAFASLAQLNAWFSLRWRKRCGYLGRGAVIREYRGPRVLFGLFQCVIHHTEAARVGTFHIYRPTERIYK